LTNPIGFAEEEEKMAIIWPWNELKLNDYIKIELLSDNTKLDLILDILNGVEEYHHLFSSPIGEELQSMNIYIINNRAVLGPHCIKRIIEHTIIIRYYPQTQDSLISLLVDSYYIGVIIWELFCMRTPFPKDMEIKQIKTEYQSDSILVKIINDCFSENPLDRPSITEIVDQIQRIKENSNPVQNSQEISKKKVTKRKTSTVELKTSELKKKGE